MEIAALKASKKFVEIWDESTSYYGGDQKWFDSKMARQCACGTVAAANIVAYMSRLDIHNYNKLYAYGDFSKINFVNHMKDMYKFLAPGRIPWTQIGLGIWPLGKFKKGVEKFAKEKGVNLHGVENRGKFTLENIVGYITKGLQADAPVAMLIDFNHYMRSVRVQRPNGSHWIQSSIEAHWVVITELLRDNDSRYIVKVSTWGSYAYLDLAAYIEGALVYQGLLFFK
jgi:hypothetical protein